MNDIIAEIERHKDQFYRFLMRNLWDTSMTEDVFASAVLAAYENRHKFQPGTNFRAWMFKILVNKCYVANREHARAFEPLKEEIVDPSEGVSGRYTPETLITNPKEFLEQCDDEVYHAFKQLSPAQRACILLKDVEQFSYQEIAEILEIPAGTVMTHLARGRSALRSRLAEYARRNGILHGTSRRNGHVNRSSSVLQMCEEAS
ncbi:MAG TPA: RNA polymerase sigma factor [Candidatus Hydrogenedentes bacterium]|nr:RNA polymerase sigma factor [Candidatus Hydrogenedentota bacterium]